MRFADLIDKVPSVQREGNADADVTAIADDSRKVVPGTLFVARGGARADGGAFVADAIKRGAVAIVAAPGVAVPANMKCGRPDDEGAKCPKEARNPAISASRAVSRVR